MTSATPYRVVAIPTSVADSVRTTRQSPFAGHPTHVEIAQGHGPCRHCLQEFRVGEERRILFTLDEFSGLEPYPQPGPVFIHEQPCDRYAECAEMPEALKAHPLTLVAYARGRVLRQQERVETGDFDEALERLLQREDVDYIHVRDTSAGCFDLRIEKTATSSSDSESEATCC